MRYLMAYLPRTGSWMLTDALNGTGIAGRLREPIGVEPERQGRVADLDYVASAFRDSRSDNGVSGLRVHWSGWHRLPEQLKLRDVADLHYLLGEPKYILTLRRDKARQAVSLVKASQTGEWWKFPRPRKWVKTDREPVYSREEIDRAIKRIAELESSWRDYFAAIRVTPHEVWYEDLFQDYEPTVRGVLDFLGLPHDGVNVPPPRLLPQADEVTEEWLRRYQGSDTK